MFPNPAISHLKNTNIEEKFTPNDHTSDSYDITIRFNSANVKF